MVAAARAGSGRAKGRTRRPGPLLRRSNLPASGGSAERGRQPLEQRHGPNPAPLGGAAVVDVVNLSRLSAGFGVAAAAAMFTSRAVR